MLRKAVPIVTNGFIGLCVSPVTMKGHHLRPLHVEIMWFSNYGCSNMLVNAGRLKTSTGAYVGLTRRHIMKILLIYKNHHDGGVY
jgi:hypothetical protein